MEINEIIATKIMGWQRHGDKWVDPAVEPLGVVSYNIDLFSPSTDMAHASWVESKIIRMEDREKYIEHLIDALDARGKDEQTIRWRIARAKPFERCVAALRLANELKEDTNDS